MIDWNRVDELREEIGEDDLAEVIQMFLDEVAEKLAELQCGASPASLVQDMHFLKSSALNIGFADLARMCSAAEVQAETDGRAVNLHAIQSCFDASSKELRTHEAIRAA